jgi:serine/threonine protein kinase
MRSDAAIDPRFELVDELGRGGMGIVYRARDRHHGGEVALKALLDVKPGELLRLKREFRVMCNVRHPNLVRLGELVERDGGWFFTMELVDGVDFLAWVRAPNPTARDPQLDVVATSPVTTAEPAAARAAARRAAEDVTHTMTEGIAYVPPEPPPASQRPPASFDEARLRAALRGVADGLAGLHGAGLVHRDVKPSNIKIDANGRVVLLDFGVAIALHETDREIAGTFGYMAPEQATGTATPATDWYAVGVMLYRAMTGHLPFAPTRAALEQKAREPAPTPDDFVRDLPRDLVGLCRRLMAPDPAQRAGEADVRAVVGVALPLRAPNPSIAPFVGRKREREQLAGLRARQLRDGGCHVALIVGPSGVGKTALARRFLDELVTPSGKALLLESRCDERETVPFNALDGIVDGLARLVTRHPDRLPPGALDALRTTDAAELRRLFPVLADVVRRSRGSLSLDDSRAAAARALRDVLSAIGGSTPLVLLIDDSQWADADSCALLADLLATPAPPALVIATARGPERPSLVAGLAQVEEITLAGLDSEDAVALASAIAAPGGEPVDAAAIAREAQGHPMFIAELSRFAAERRASAGSLDEALWARAGDLTPGARRLLHVVVTDGAALPRALAVSAAELAPDEAADAIAELRAARLIRAGDEVVEPYHDRVREALAGRLPRAEQAALHLLLGRALEASGSPPERLAHHWAGAGEHALAARAAELASERAADALAFERAAEWLAMALRLGDYEDARRRALFVARAEALTHAGRPRDAGLAYLEAARCGELSTIEQRDLRRRAAERLLAGGYSVEGLEVARTLLEEVGLSWPTSRGAALRSLFWHHIRVGTSTLRWRSRAEDELTAEQKLRLDTCWSAALGLSMLDSMRGTTFAFRALLMTLAAGEPRRIANTLAGAAFAAAGMNQHRRLRRLTKAIARAVAETDAPEARCYVALAETARAYFVDNDWPATREIAQRGLDLWTSAGRGHTWEVDLFEQFTGWAISTCGDYRASANHAESVVRAARRRGDRYLEIGFRLQFPWRHFLDDRPDDGVRDVDDALASWAMPHDLEPISNMFYWGWRARAMLAIYSDRCEADAAWLDDGYQRIVASLLWQVPAARLDVSIWAGAASVARAAEARRSGRRVREHLAAIRQRMKTIAASPLPARAGSLASFRAAVAHLEGDDERAVAELRSALPLLDRLRMVGPAAAVRWRLGQLLGGDEGTALLDDARAWFASLRAVRPERMVACGMPGIGD